MEPANVAVALLPTPLGLAIKNSKLFFTCYTLVEPQIRLELMTCRLQGGCSTN